MISILKNSVLLFKQQLKGQLYTGRNISVVKSVLMSCVLASSAVGKQQAQAKSVSSFLFAERSICYGGMAVLRRDALGCSLLFATSPALLPWRQHRNRRSAQCVTVGRGQPKSGLCTELSFSKKCRWHWSVLPRVVVTMM